MKFPFQPMPLSRRAQPFNHPEWVFEIKHDGFRALAYVKAGQCQLVSLAKGMSTSDSLRWLNRLRGA